MKTSLTEIDLRKIDVELDVVLEPYFDLIPTDCRNDYTFLCDADGSCEEEDEDSVISMCLAVHFFKLLNPADVKRRDEAIEKIKAYACELGKRFGITSYEEPDHHGGDTYEFLINFE